MNWKYHIPHIWETPRAVWEDVWLLPDDKNYKGKSVWLTVDALGDVSNPTHGSDRPEFQRDALQKLGDNNFWIESGDMIVRAVDFSKEEFLDYVRIWLRESGFECELLIESPFEDFARTNQHAEILTSLREQKNIDSE